MILVVTEVAWDGRIQRRMLDTAMRRDAARWEALVGHVPALAPPYRAGPGQAVYHISVEDHVLLVGEHDLQGPLRDLVVAVLTAGSSP